MQPQTIGKNNKEQYSPHSKGAASPAESGFKIMKKLSETPFINISAENLDAANDMLDRNQKGELLEMIIEAVRNDGTPITQDRYVRGVFNQFMSVIERKAKGYAQRQEALDKVNEAKKKKTEPEPEVSTYTPKEEEKPKNEVEFAKSIKDLYRSDRFKAERIMNRECRDNGYSFDNVLSVIKAS